MPQSLAFFQGKVVPIEETQVNVMTHALHYGTAVFEGIRGNWNSVEEKLYVFRMEEHYERLLQGCSMLMLNIPYTASDLCQITIDLLRQCDYKQDLYIRPLAYKSEELVANLKLQEIDNILKCSPEAIKKSKELLKSLSGQKPEEFFELTTNILADSWESKEGKQGIQAFFEKRPAPWVKKGENHG